MRNILLDGHVYKGQVSEQGQNLVLLDSMSLPLSEENYLTAFNNAYALFLK